MSSFRKNVRFRFGILLFVFAFVFAENYFNSTLSIVEASSHDHVEQVKKVSAFIRDNGYKGKNKYYIEWNAVDKIGYIAQIYRKSPTKLGFSYSYLNHNGVLISAEADLTGKTKSMKYKITIIDLSSTSDNQENAAISVTTAVIKDISKYKGNKSEIVVSDSDLDSFISDMTKERIKTLVNAIIDDSLEGINTTLLINQMDEENQLFLYDLGFNKRYRKAEIVKNP